MQILFPLTLEVVIRGIDEGEDQRIAYFSRSL